MGIVFTLRPRRFPIKIIYISTFLIGTASTCFKNSKDENNEPMRNLNAFWNVLLNRFGIALAVEEQEAALRQDPNDKIDEFNNKFRSLALKLKFNDEAIKSLNVGAINQNKRTQLYQEIDRTLLKNNLVLTKNRFLVAKKRQKA